MPRIPKEIPYEQQREMNRLKSNGWTFYGWTVHPNPEWCNAIYFLKSGRKTHTITVPPENVTPQGI